MGWGAGRWQAGACVAGEHGPPAFEPDRGITHRRVVHPRLELCHFERGCIVLGAECAWVAAERDEAERAQPPLAPEPVQPCVDVVKQQLDEPAVGVPCVQEAQRHGHDGRAGAIKGDPVWHPHIGYEAVRELALEQGGELGVGERASADGGELHGSERVVPHEGHPRPAPSPRALNLRRGQRGARQEVPHHSGS